MRQRLHRGEARLAGRGVERLQRLQPPPAGDQAVGQGAGERRHHYGRALAVHPDRLAQGIHLGVLGRQPVAGQMVRGDGVEREVEHQAPGLAGAGDALGKVGERGGVGGVGDDPGDRRGEAQHVAARRFRARNVEHRAEGQAAAGHQAGSFCGSRASSSRRQAASSSRLKAA